VLGARRVHTQRLRSARGPRPPRFPRVRVPLIASPLERKQSRAPAHPSVAKLRHPPLHPQATVSGGDRSPRCVVDAAVGARANSLARYRALSNRTRLCSHFAPSLRVVGGWSRLRPWRARERLTIFVDGVVARPQEPHSGSSGVAASPLGVRGADRRRSARRADATSVLLRRGSCAHPRCWSGDLEQQGRRVPRRGCLAPVGAVEDSARAP